MRIKDKVVVIESFDEANAVFYRPVESGQYEGSRSGYYAAVIFLGEGLPRNEYEGYSVSFANKQIEKYWNMLVEADYDRRYVKFDFDTGEEGERSWWGFEKNCISRLDGDEDIKSYHMVAKAIANKGFDAFDFSVYDDEENVTRTIEVVDKKTNSLFNFNDSIDPNMYDDLREWVMKNNKSRVKKSIVDSANQFLKEIS